jgi:hypothetical protein
MIASAYMPKALRLGYLGKLPVWFGFVRQGSNNVILGAYGRIGPRAILVWRGGRR